MFDPLTIGVGFLVWSAFKKQSNTDYGVLTPAREEVYKNALAYGQDPVRIAKLAEEFDKFGLKAQAAVMRERAKWYSRTPEVRRKHSEIFAKALQSDKPEAILEIAKLFHGMTATVKAKQLRERAHSLLKARNEKTEDADSNVMSGHNEKDADESGLPKNSAAAE